MEKIYYWNYTLIEGMQALVACDAQSHLVWLGFVPANGGKEKVYDEMLQDLGAQASYKQDADRLQSALSQKTPNISFAGGTDFQQQVWNELLKIPQGSIVSYSDIAQAIHKPKAVRAVGTAVGRNFISYFVPCHRVIRKDGSYKGYRWGTDIKRVLLKKEAA